MSAAKVRIDLKKFNMSLIKDNSVIQFLGIRGSGKSFLLRNLCYFKKNIPCGTIISPTESSNEFFGNFVPSIFIFYEFEPQILDRFVKRQIMITKKYNKEIKMNGRTSIDPRAICILDDCLASASTWLTDKNIKFLFLNGRHCHILFCITSQYPLGMPPLFRTNIDLTFVLREPIKSNRKRIYESYAGMVPSLDMFETIMDACTSNYECLVVSSCTTSNKLEDQLFWYKAPETQAFRLGAAQFWEMSALAEAEGEDEEEYNPEREMQQMMSAKKRNSMAVTIRKKD